MTIETKPSVFHWIVAAAILLILVGVAWLPILFVVAQFLPVEQRLLASCLGCLVVALLLLPLVTRSGRAARWSVDLEGLSSPVVGRISFSDVVSLHEGYPRDESLPMAAFQRFVAAGSGITDRTLVLRLHDGRLLPLNLVSPAIRGGPALMQKLKELLAGKKLPNDSFSKAEALSLKSRPMNRIVIPKAA